jgi:hypothetical protein
MDEVARKEEVICLQAAQIRALLAADDDSQAHIASLEATLLKNADAHAARALADDLKISGQAKEIAALSGKVKTLRADAAAALVSKVALEAQVAADAEKLRRRNIKIADLAVQLSTHKQIQARVSAKIAEDSTTIAQPARPDLPASSPGHEAEGEERRKHVDTGDADCRDLRASGQGQKAEGDSERDGIDCHQAAQGRRARSQSPGGRGEYGSEEA